MTDKLSIPDSIAFIQRRVSKCDGETTVEGNTVTIRLGGRTYISAMADYNHPPDETWLKVDPSLKIMIIGGLTDSTPTEHNCLDWFRTYFKQNPPIIDAKFHHLPNSPSIYDGSSRRFQYEGVGCSVGRFG